VQQIGRGAKVFDHAPVRGRFCPMDGPDDVLALMDSGAHGVVALVRDAGATFLAPIYHELTAIICTSGTLRSHIGIVSREFQVPCVMACSFDGAEPEPGTEVELDCTGEEAIVRA
jgi:signal transduction protein with GAF and PtsI domain